MRAPILLACLALAAAPLTAMAQGSAAPPSEGKRLFDHKCGMCHNATGMGTGLLARRVPAGQAELEKRDGLNAAYIVKAARMGVGNMPPITRGDVPDPELAAIAAYLAKAPAR